MRERERERERLHHYKTMDQLKIHSIHNYILCKWIVIKRYVSHIPRLQVSGIRPHAQFMYLMNKMYLSHKTKLSTLTTRIS